MTEASKVWMDNAYWENYTQDKVKCILVLTDESGVTINQQLTLSKFAPDGSENTDFIELMEQVGADRITQNTTERTTAKAEDRQKKEQEKIEQERAKSLHRLFEAKIQAFEIDAIKNSTNRVLKSKLRKAQNLIEVNVYSMMIIMEDLNNAESGTV
jgi:hypothetical protein